MKRQILAYLSIFGILLPNACLHAQNILSPSSVEDSDGDGLADSLENTLLAQFQPVFMVSSTDCSVAPAQFLPAVKKPTVVADDGTIYGQASPRNSRPDEVELHYYHLWRKDCGELGHALDAEHVSSLVHLGRDHGAAKALYWYAAAHEDTMCDASHLARAATISAEDHGATVWISPGKHASFLSEVLCSYGCGGDHCEHMEPLKVRAVVNVGEFGMSMHNIAWLQAPGWPLQDKLRRSDFSESRLLRVSKLPQTNVVWANPSKRPAQATILGTNAGMGGVATGARATDTALVIADGNTSSALGVAADRTGNALDRSSHNVWNALKKSAQKTGDFLNANHRH